MTKIKNRNMQAERNEIPNCVRNEYTIARTNSWNSAPRIYHEKILKFFLKIKKIVPLPPYFYLNPVYPSFLKINFYVAK